MYTEQVEMKEDITLPGGLETFEGQPFHPDSKHAFADMMLFIKAGCYQVRVTPEKEFQVTDEFGNPEYDEHDEPVTDKKEVEKCIPVQKTLEVKPGEFTERFLISQCAPPKDAKGLMDIITALNDPPKLEKFKQDPQKFQGCPEEGDTVTLCAEAEDPNDDPMNLIWAVTDEDGTLPYGPDDDDILQFALLQDDPRIRSFRPLDAGDYPVTFDDNNEQEFDFIDEPGHISQCVEIELEPIIGAIDFAAVAVDKLPDNGDLISFEQWFYDRGIVDRDGNLVESRATQHSRYYITGCDEEAGLASCNRSRGYYSAVGAGVDVEERWANSSYDPSDPDEPKLCESENGVHWLSILRNPGTYKNHFYNLARAYIVAELNYSKFDWENSNADSELLALIEAAKDFLEGNCDRRTEVATNELIEVKSDDEEFTTYEVTVERMQEKLEAFIRYCQTLDRDIFISTWLQGCERNRSGWFDHGDGTVHREKSGYTDTYASGVDSADGNWHARLRTADTPGCELDPPTSARCVGPFTRFGGPYADTYAFDSFSTSIDIYLDTDYAADNDDHRFEWSVAVNESDQPNKHLRDFVFNVGTVASAGAFSISTSRNAGRSQGDPYDADAIKITTSGWYTFRHKFFDDDGDLGVTAEILDDAGDVVHSWDASAPTPDDIDDVGRVRYGWFANQEIEDLAIDNTVLEHLLFD